MSKERRDLYDEELELDLPLRSGPAPGKSALTSRLSGVMPLSLLRQLSAGPVMRKSNGGGVTTGATSSIAAAQSSGGSPLPDDPRASFSRSLGVDLDAVRIHTSNDAATAAASVGARAFTLGNDIYFGEGQYNPGSADGKTLLAHEVVHTVQQSGGATRPQYKLAVSRPSDALEVEADRLAERMVAGQSARVTGVAAAGTAYRVLDEQRANQSRQQIRAQIDMATPAALEDIIRGLELRGAPAVAGPDGEITVHVSGGSYYMRESDIDPLVALARSRLAAGDQGPPQRPPSQRQSQVATEAMLRRAVNGIDRIRVLDRLSQQVQSIGFTSDRTHPLQIGSETLQVPGSLMATLQRLLETRLTQLDSSQAPALPESSGNAPVCEPSVTPTEQARAPRAGRGGGGDFEDGAPAGFEMIRDFPFPPLNVRGTWADIEFRGLAQLAAHVSDAAEGNGSSPDNPSVTVRAGGDQPGRPRQGASVDGLIAQIGNWFNTDFGGCSDEITIDRESGGFRFRLGVVMPTIHFGPIDLKIRINLIETQRGSWQLRGPSATASIRTPWFGIDSNNAFKWRSRIDATIRPNWTRIMEWCGEQWAEVESSSITSAELAGSGTTGAAGEAAAAAEAATAAEAEAATLAEEAAVLAEEGAAAGELAEGAVVAGEGIALAEVVVPALILAGIVGGVYYVATHPDPLPFMARDYGHRLHSFSAAYAATLRGQAVPEGVYGPGADAGRRLAHQRIGELRSGGMSLAAIHENARDTQDLYDRAFDAARPHVVNDAREECASNHAEASFPMVVRIIDGFRRSPTGRR